MKKNIFIPIAIVILGLAIYNANIKDKKIVDINTSQLSNELNITGHPIRNPTDLMRYGVEIPLKTMCEKAGGTLFGGKCYEGKAKPIVVDENRTK